MPLFRRSDGTLVPGLSPLRRIVPYLMRGRNESVVLYEEPIDLAAALPFIERWNREHAQRLTLFHLILAALGRLLLARPGLNRFVSGGRIYQRHGVHLSFAAKRAFDDEAPIVTIKLEVLPGEPLERFVARIHAAVGEGRSGRERAVDKEVRLVMALPGVLVRAGLWLARLLDRWNLLPAFFTRGDPMFSSLFCANLGSLGIDRAYHHLYEYGTTSLFCVIGAAGPAVVVGEDGRPAVRDTVHLRYTFDERINDGFYCARSLDLVRELLEHPERLVDGEAPAPAGTAATAPPG